MTWHHSAACLGLAQPWHDPWHPEDATTNATLYDEARAICEQCPVWQPCLALDAEAIIAEYKAGGSLQDLANRHHCHQRRIRDVITSAGHSIRPHGAWRKGEV